MNQLISFIGGLGLLLYGLTIFEDMLRSFGGRKLKKYIVAYTTNSWMSLLVGMIITGIFSSSSLVTLLVIALTGAGLIPLKNAVGLVIGANVGTTFDDFFIARLGFGTGIDLGIVALPLVGITGILTLFVKREKFVQIIRLLFGFGLLLVGLSFMKEASSLLDPSMISSLHLGLWGWGVVGAGVTALLQLMGAVAMITFSALHAGLITFPESIAILMGSNIGATVNAVLASFGGRVIKRQVALSNVLFNVISALLGAVFFWQFIDLTLLFGFREDVLGSAFFNVVFNVAIAILFGFFLKPFTCLIEWILPTKQNSGKLIIEQFSLEKLDGLSIEPLLAAFRGDSIHLLYMSILYQLQIVGVNENEYPLIYSDLAKTSIQYLLHDANDVGDKIEEKLDILLSYHQRISKESLSRDQVGVMMNKFKCFEALLKQKRIVDGLKLDVSKLAGTGAKEVEEIAGLIEKKIASLLHAVVLLLQESDDDRISAGLHNIESQIEGIQRHFNHDIPGTMKKVTEEETISALLAIHTYIPLSLRYLFIALKNHEKTGGKNGFLDLV